MPAVGLLDLAAELRLEILRHVVFVCPPWRFVDDGEADAAVATLLLVCRVLHRDARQLQVEVDCYTLHIDGVDELFRRWTSMRRRRNTPAWSA